MAVAALVATVIMAMTLHDPLHPVILVPWGVLAVVYVALNCQKKPAT
jgi:hypothetical protein